MGFEIHGNVKIELVLALSRQRVGEKPMDEYYQDSIRTTSSSKTSHSITTSNHPH